LPYQSHFHAGLKFLEICQHSSYISTNRDARATVRQVGDKVLVWHSYAYCRICYIEPENNRVLIQQYFVTFYDSREKRSIEPFKMQQLGFSKNCFYQLHWHQLLCLLGKW